ncbi:CehA/McbA family metallohydrolase [Clostridium sp.]|uniref:CehA/McbA family metallohydrolase n=1 Tax=Clostridium sp. TaxID=1506 RepID=UPI003217C20A
MRKRNHKVLSFMTALLFLVTYIALPSVNAFAADTLLEVALSGDESEVVIFSEGFTGTKNEVKPVGEGWTIVRKGAEATSFQGYDSKDNFGVAPPSVGFGKSIKANEEESLETPEFTLSSVGKLSFWYKGQSISTDKLSILKVELKVNGEWQGITVPDITKAGIFEAEIPKDTTRVKLTYNKNSGNLAIDDIKVTCEKVAEPDTEAPAIEHTAILKAPIDVDLVIESKVMDNKKVEAVTLNYRVKGTEDFKTLNMSKLEESKYTASIVKEDLDIKGVEYYIVATDGTNSTRTPNEGSYSVEIIDEDMVGPEIYDLAPAEGNSVGEELRPQIKASMKDKTGVDATTVKVFFNGTEVTKKATITKSSVAYIPTEDLADGTHKVKIEVKDTLGNQSVKEWSFRKGKLSHYFGQLHAHTNISDGTGTLDEAYNWAIKNGADYLAVTDHSNWFDNDTAGNLGNGSASKAWTSAQTISNKYNKNGDFTAIYGYEMTWSGSTGGWGHMNTFNTPGFETRTNKSMDLQTYYNTLQTQPQSVSQLNHPGKTFGDFADFGFYSQGADKVVNLIEVGNGEGPIRGSGYFPSYEYYTRALDKGWHVAPTNNQDNHKGKWFTANTARTVIVAGDNSRDSLYEAMSDKQVYASEDSNMTIDYTVNGAIMGSSLGEDVDKLSFKVDIADDDAISKVSVIANGGVEVTSKEINSNNANWEFELSPEYTYYYIKVVQADKDIAVTAPVWIGDSSNVGLTEVKVDNELALENENVEVSVGVYNNETKALNNLKVEFFTNEISEENKIGEKVIPIVEANKTENVVLNWVPTKQGEYTIYAKTTLPVSGNEKVFTKSVKVKVVNPENTYKVLLDGAHYNQYVTGNYAGKYTAIKSLLDGRNAITKINKEPITDDILKGVNILVITDPQSVDDTEYGLSKSKFQTSEIEAIKKYVDNGGNIIVTTKADYKDGEGEYSNGAQVNPILEAIGTELRVNDDQVVDDATNGGQAYRLYLKEYASPKYNLVDGIENGVEQYSFYSGASIILTEGTKGEKVDFLVKGHETTTANDADGKKDNVPAKMGDVSVIGAEELTSGGKVIVAGNTFFSDFEIDGTSGDTYSNKKLTNNIMDWMMPKKVAQTVNIADIRLDEDNDNVPDLKGQEFTIEGTVTSQSEAVSPKNSFFEVIYVEDETGGICVFGVSNTQLQVGQKVRITGVVDEYQGEFEIAITDEDAQLKIIDETINKLNPFKVSTGDSMVKANGGKLVSVEGKVVDMDESNLYINDGSGISRAYVEGYIWDGINETMKGKWNSEIEIGDTVKVVGLASMDPEGARLRVRNTSEIELVKKADPVDPPVDPVDPVDPPVDPVNPTDPGKEKPDSVKPDTGDNKPNKPSKPSLPKTGGSSTAMVIGVVGVIAVAGGVFLIRKKKED